LDYDHNGELKSRTLPRADGQYGPTLKLSYQRDPVGNPTTITDPRKHSFNVARLSYSRQLRDYADYASANSLRLDVYVRGGTRVSGPLARADLDPASPINIVRHLP